MSKIWVDVRLVERYRRLLEAIQAAEKLAEKRGGRGHGGGKLDFVTLKFGVDGVRALDDGDALELARVDALLRGNP